MSVCVCGINNGLLKMRRRETLSRVVVMSKRKSLKVAFRKLLESWSKWILFQYLFKLIIKLYINQSIKSTSNISYDIALSLHRKNQDLPTNFILWYKSPNFSSRCIYIFSFLNRISCIVPIHQLVPPLIFFCNLIIIFRDHPFVNNATFSFLSLQFLFHLKWKIMLPQKPQRSQKI